MNNILTILRHGESQWNLEKRFTGLTDIGLTQKGIEEAKNAGQILLSKNIHFDMAFCSNLQRAKHTLDLTLDAMQHVTIKSTQHDALNERDFGDLSGKYHDQVTKDYSQNQVDIWRKSYDIAPPNGESLKDLIARCLPYFSNEILPHYHAGKNILIVAHNVTIRALIMHIEQISEKDIINLSIRNADPLTFKLNRLGHAI